MMAACYSVSDSNSADHGLSYSEAIGRIAEWYEDVDQWSDGEGDDETHEAVAEAIESIALPAGGRGFVDLQRYADDICEAVAEALGGKDFAGHGNYFVSAADRLGVVLLIRED